MKEKAGVILKRCMYVIVQMYVHVIVNTKAMYMYVHVSHSTE